MGSSLVRGLLAVAWHKGILEGLDMDISLGGEDGGNNQWYPDVVAPSDSQVVVFWNLVTDY